MAPNENISQASWLEGKLNKDEKKEQIKQIPLRRKKSC